MNGDEKSIIDFAIVCQEMFSLFKCMKIDPDNAFTNYSKKTIKKSDHHLLVCSFEINFSQNKIEQKKRKTVFNFRSSEGWEKYKEMTSGNQLLNCIKGVNILEEGRIWLKHFKNI